MSQRTVLGLSAVAGVLVAAAIAAVVIAAAVLVGGSDEGPDRARATAEIVERRLAPRGDTYVNEDDPRTSFTLSSLRLDAVPRKTAYLHFELGKLAGRVERARLHIFANSASVDGYEVRGVPQDSWDGERELTLATAPEVSSQVLARSKRIGESTWTTVNVTPLAIGGSTRSVTVALTTEGETAINLASSEEGAHAPWLSVRARTTAEAPSAGERLLAVGDIATCEQSEDEETARIVAERDGAVAVLGDTVYEKGTPDEYRRCYEPAWGRFKDRTRPAVGNHEYGTPGAQGYFDYFGAAAGSPLRGYYSYELGAWHVVVINSNCSQIGGCAAGSLQEQWLRADLAASPAVCTLAYWHHPRFSSGQHGSYDSLQPIWQALYEAGAEVVLSGHDHDYERFAPQTATGALDPERGIRQFVVGTGGKGGRPLNELLPNSEASDDTTRGVLEMSLRADGYDWRFLPIRGQGFSDEGSEKCH